MFEIPRINHLSLDSIKSISLTVAEVKSLSDSELLQILSRESKYEGIVPIPLQQLITAELLERNLAKSRVPHWSVLPSFWLLVATVILATVSLVATVAALPEAQKLCTSL